ncbi:MAG: TSUP family transporter, partial [Paracoccus sp. (in: a-proteobacteria)]|nr:TSUP family transporter [Paracoccus sp. (in: a-proteobacteria)]
VAGLGGAFLVSAIPTGGLRLVLPVVLIGIALFFALKPGLNDQDRAQRLTPAAFTAFIVPLIGFYDGLLGPGAGAFYMLGFVMLAGYGILKATAHTKLLNFASNIGGLVAFALVGKPLWLIGLAMGVAQMAGAFLGARLAMRVGARVIKPLLVITSTVLALRLIWQALSP